MAAGNGHLSATQALLAAGANIELTDQAGKTALMWAARWGQVETARQRLQMLEAQLAQQHASRDGPGPTRQQQHNTAAQHRRADVRRVEKAQRPRPAMAWLQQRRSLSSLPSCDSLPSFVDVNMSFDTFLDAMLVLFQMVTTSNWHEVMYTAMWATGA